MPLGPQALEGMHDAVSTSAGPLKGTLASLPLSARPGLLLDADALLRPFAARRYRGAHSRVR